MCSLEIGQLVLAMTLSGVHLIRKFHIVVPHHCAVMLELALASFVVIFVLLARLHASTLALGVLRQIAVATFFLSFVLKLLPRQMLPSHFLVDMLLTHLPQTLLNPKENLVWKPLIYHVLGNKYLWVMLLTTHVVIFPSVLVFNEATAPSGIRWEPARFRDEISFARRVRRHY